jgi:hypothetical protein
MSLLSPPQRVECSLAKAAEQETPLDLYHIWCDLRPEVSDMQFADRVSSYLSRLREDGRISSFRLCRRKLGLGPSEIGEFHIQIEVRDLAQLDQAFREVSSRADPIEELHAGVNQLVRGIRFALYRDFPDGHRQTGQERF